MNPELSYKKGILIGSSTAWLIASAAFGAAFRADGSSRVIGLSISVFALLSWLLFIYCGRLVLKRERRANLGEPDLFLSANLRLNEKYLSQSPIGATPLRRWLAKLLQGHDLLAGDTVEIRSVAEIQATLDSNGLVDGLPFMPEMARLCGQRARVFRVLDKVYDYGKSKRMRRVDNAVLLVGMHCDGSAHGGCEAGCSMIWRTNWLQRAPAALPTTKATMHEPRTAIPDRGAESPTRLFKCQFTQLSDASRPLSTWSIRKEIRPVLSGNFTWRTMLIGWATRAFNLVQQFRRGATFPTQQLAATPPIDASIAVGDSVRVRPSGVIAATLNAQNKNRGLWFDRDMLKHCHHTYQVERRVSRIVDVNSGSLITMKTPCYVLAGVCYSGEFQQFGPQHEDLYWRSIWLEPAQVPSALGDRRIGT